MFKPMALLAALLFVSVAGAQTAGQTPEQLLAQKLAKTFPGIQAENIRATQAPGIFEISVQTARGMVIGHATANGEYFIDGDLIEVKTGRSLTEDRRRLSRLQRLNEIGEEKMIVYRAPNEKHVMTVFTDIDCGYCRKLHREMDQYHARGISVRYLFYPRSGPNTPSFSKAESVWCSDDRNSAMTRAKNGQTVVAQSCAAPVLDHYQMGREFGIRGTPALVLDDGSLQAGYIPAGRLAALFGGS